MGRWTPRSIWAAREAPDSHLDRLEAPERDADSPGGSRRAILDCLGGSERQQKAIWIAREAAKSQLGSREAQAREAPDGVREHMQAKPTNAKKRKGEAATPATEQGVAAEPKKERRRDKDRPFRFCEWGMAARPIGGHENLWNGTKAREAPETEGSSRKLLGQPGRQRRANGVAERHRDSVSLGGPRWTTRAKRVAWEAPESHLDCLGDSRGRRGGSARR